MNEVSIILNGVRYDVVEMESGTSVCKECDLCRFCDDIPGVLTPCDIFDIKENYRHFKKSAKSFES